MEPNSNENQLLIAEVKMLEELNYQLVRDNAYLMHVNRELRVGHAKQRSIWQEPTSSEKTIRDRIEAYRSILQSRDEKQKLFEIKSVAGVLELPLLPKGNL